MIFSPSFVEKQLKSWQTERIAKDSRTHLAGSMVMADDSALIFLPGPQGPEIYERFKSRLDALEKTS